MTGRQSKNPKAELIQLINAAIGALKMNNSEVATKFLEDALKKVEEQTHGLNS
jgi:hypothetical protein